MRALSHPFQNFWSHVEKTADCWLWNGVRMHFGHGRMYCGKVEGHILAHRVSWRIHNGPIPDGLNVLHRCDNPPCVNPEHLFLGTHQDNIKDRDQKGRGARLGGERNGCSILKEADVRQIRSLWPSKSQTELARMFGVHLSTVHLIVHRRHWKDVA
jgi:hypothetical protein